MTANNAKKLVAEYKAKNTDIGIINSKIEEFASKGKSGLITIDFRVCTNQRASELKEYYEALGYKVSKMKIDEYNYYLDIDWS